MLLVMIVTCPVFSQNLKKIDSLKTLLGSARDTTRFKILSELFKQTNQSDFNEALGYATQAYDQAEAIGDSAKIVEGGRMIAYSLDDLGRNDEVIDVLNKVIGIAVRNQERYPELKPKLKFLLNNAGIAYMHRGNYDSSLSYHFRSLEIRETEGDKKSIGTARNNIGVVYFKLRNYEKALEYYLQSLAIKKELNDNVDLDRILSNVGLCYNALRSFDEAIESFNEALNICKDNCSEAVIKEANFGLGEAYRSRRNFDKAKEKYIISLDLSKKQNDTQYWIENLIGLGKIERELKNYEGSIKYLEEAYELVQGSEYAELLINVYKESFTTYNLTSDFKNAALFQERYIKLKDSIYSGNLIKNLARIQTNYENRENLKTIRLINENIKLKDEQIQRQRIQYLFIVLVTMLIVLLATVLIWANRRQHRHNAALSEAKRVIEDQNKELTKSNEELDRRVQQKTRDLFLTNESLSQVNEELDNFIYRTSHDIRGPLVTLKGVCNVALLDVKDTLAQDYLKRLDITAEKLNSILTRLLIVNQINHSELDASTIDFKQMIDDILVTERKNGLPPKLLIEYELDPNVRLISDRQLVKIVLENLIDNAIKFYNTSERISPYVKIKVDRANADKVRIRVEDNGIGINPRDKDQIFHLFVRASERSETGGIGLYLSKLSTHRLGGEIILADTSEKGTAFMVLVPSDLRPILEKRREEEELRKKDKALREKEMEASRDQEAKSEMVSSKQNKVPTS
jgi:signal transduction histidine kinase/Flp pilus assembly protein TadD